MYLNFFEAEETNWELKFPEQNFWGNIEEYAHTHNQSPEIPHEEAVANFICFSLGPVMTFSVLIYLGLHCFFFRDLGFRGRPVHYA
jgi:hypothetical protein